MKTYRLTDRSCRWAAFKRALFALTALLLAGAGGLLFLASRSLLTIHSAWPLGLFLIVGCLFLPFGAWRMRVAMGTYRLSLSEDRLTQSMRGANDVTVGRDEVTEIIETPGTSLVVTPTTLLVVRSGERRRYIMVFDGLEEYADLRERLAAWRNVRIQPRSLWFTAVQQAAFLPLFACMVAAFLSSSPYVVVPCTLAFAVAMVVLLWMMQRSPHAATWAKVLSWALLLPLVMLVGRIAWICGLIGK